MWSTEVPLRVWGIMICSVGSENSWFFYSMARTLPLWATRYHIMQLSRSTPFLGSNSSSPQTRYAALQASTMEMDSRLQKRQNNALTLLNAAIETMNLAKEISSATPAKAVFGSVGVLLTMINVCFPFFDILFQAQTQPGLHGQ